MILKVSGEDCKKTANIRVKIKFLEILNSEQVSQSQNTCPDQAKGLGWEPKARTGVSSQSKAQDRCPEQKPFVPHHKFM